jgi:hypothetical protein
METKRKLLTTNDSDITTSHGRREDSASTASLLAERAEQELIFADRHYPLIKPAGYERRYPRRLRPEAESAGLRGPSLEIGDLGFGSHHPKVVLSALQYPQRPAFGRLNDGPLRIFGFAPPSIHVPQVQSKQDETVGNRLDETKGNSEVDDSSLWRRLHCFQQHDTYSEELVLTWSILCA